MLTTDQTAYIDTCKNEWQDILTFGKRSDSTIRNYFIYGLPFLDFCFETQNKHPSSADESDVRAYLRSIQSQRDLSDRTIDAARSAVRNLFEAVLNLPFNKFKVPFIPFEEYVAFIPTKEEMEQFLLASDCLKSKAIFAIMYATGARVSETCRLHFNEISKSNRYIKISSKSKRHKERIVQMPDNCFQAIYDYGKSLQKESKHKITATSLLFPSTRSFESECSHQYVRNEICRIERLLGWDHRFTCHTFRRAFATHNFLDGNMTLEDIQLALGHKQLSTTKIYVEKGIMALAIHHPNSIDGMNI